MAQIAATVLNAPVAFRLSIENVEKPMLGVNAIEQRLTQFGGEATICLTRAATFAQKVRMFSRVTFVVGADTILRVADERFYANDPLHRDAALQSIIQSGARFLVFGRSIDDRFQTLTHLDLPEPLLAICREVSEADFRHDISSSDIRRSNSACE